MLFSTTAILGLAAVSLALPSSEPSPEAQPSCNSTSGQATGNININGCTWGVFCNTQINGGNLLGRSFVNNIRTCIADCEKLGKGCDAIEFTADADGECLMYTDIGGTEILSGTEYAGLRSCKSTGGK